jgi:hypothetical protein
MYLSIRISIQRLSYVKNTHKGFAARERPNNEPSFKPQPPKDLGFDKLLQFAKCDPWYSVLPFHK